MAIHADSTYEKVKATAQRRADETGQDHLVYETAFGYGSIGLPRRENRYGYELRCEVVHCSTLAKCLPGHGPVVPSPAKPSTVTYTVYPGEFSTPEYTVALHHAHKTWNTLITDDTVSICATDSDPAALTPFWCVGRFDNFGRFRT